MVIDSGTTKNNGTITHLIVNINTINKGIIDMCNINANQPYSYREILEKLSTQGHSELWLSSSLGSESGKLWNNVSEGFNHDSVWVMPVITNCDGSIVAERCGGDQGWYLSGSWRRPVHRSGNNGVKGHPLHNLLSSLHQKKLLGAVIEVADEPEDLGNNRRRGRGL